MIIAILKDITLDFPRTDADCEHARDLSMGSRDVWFNHLCWKFMEEWILQPGTDSGNQQFVVDNTRLQAVYTFADHVLAKGCDRYGQTH